MCDIIPNEEICMEYLYLAVMPMMLAGCNTQCISAPNDAPRNGNANACADRLK